MERQARRADVPAWHRPAGAAVDLVRRGRTIWESLAVCLGCQRESQDKGGAGRLVLDLQLPPKLADEGADQSRPKAAFRGSLTWHSDTLILHNDPQDILAIMSGDHVDRAGC